MHWTTSKATATKGTESQAASADSAVVVHVRLNAAAGHETDVITDLQTVTGSTMTDDGIIESDLTTAGGEIEVAVDLGVGELSIEESFWQF